MNTKSLSVDNTISLVGVGNLGGPMALSLLDAGWKVQVVDRNEDRLAPLVDAGAEVGSRESLAESDILVIVVSDDEAVSSLLEGDEGALASGDRGRTVLVHSTVLPTTAQRLAELAERHGVHYLDAPVSGGADRARRGDLTVMVGAREDAIEHARPVLEAIASRVINVGPPGAGAAAKFANQLMMFSSLAGAYEALDLAHAFGVSTEAVLDVVSSSTGGSWVTENWGFFPDTAKAYSEAGTPLRDRPWKKDLYEATLAAYVAEIEIPVTALLAQTLAQRIESEAATRAKKGSAP